MIHHSAIINKKYDTFSHNKILFNIPVSRNLPHQKFLNYYSSTERKNKQKFNDYQLNNNNPYLISTENSLESKKLFYYKKFYTIESLNEDPTIRNIKLQFKNLEGKIDKIRKIVVNSNSQNKTNSMNKINQIRNIQQFKYETPSKYNIPIRNNYNEFLNSNEKYKSSKRIINISNHNIDISKVKYNLNKFIKNSFLKEVNVAKISYTPGLSESLINDYNIGKISLQYNKTPKKTINNDSSELSQLANDIIRTFELDNYKNRNIDNKIKNKNFKYSGDSKLNCENKINNNNIKRNNFLSDNKNIKCDQKVEKNPEQLLCIVTNNNLYFSPQKELNKDKIFKKEITNKKIIKFLEKENKKFSKDGINENKINNNHKLSGEENDNNILNRKLESVNKEKKDINNSKHISFDLKSPIFILYNEKEEITKIKISQNNIISSINSKDINKYKELLTKINKPKGIILPFNKEEILINKYYKSSEFKDTSELCTLNDDDLINK